MWGIKNVCRLVFFEIINGLNKKIKGEIIKQFKRNKDEKVIRKSIQVKKVLEGKEQF